jgi:propanol-preferring alcohol dehydrogenase
MKAMVLEKQKEPLILKEVPKPVPGAKELLLKVQACGICRTDLHILDGELEEPKLPLIPGHQIVGIVEKVGEEVEGFAPGDRVGVPWLGGTCGTCPYCKEGKENLCDNAEYTGYTRDGGFAEYTVSNAEYTFPLPDGLSDEQIAPLLCAGLIGYRAYRKADPEKRLGLYGFGAAAHILAQLAIYEGKKVYAFTREGDTETQEFAKKLGAEWSGSSEELPPDRLDSAIIFAPVGKLVPAALKTLKKGGRCICGGIHMSDIPAFPYKDLWEERRIESVANLTRQDGREFLEIAPKVPIQTQITTYSLEQVNEALEDLRNGAFDGAAVIV